MFRSRFCLHEVSSLTRTDFHVYFHGGQLIKRTDQPDKPDTIYVILKVIAALGDIAKYLIALEGERNSNRDDGIEVKEADLVAA